MEISFDVNPAFENWMRNPDEANLQQLVKRLERFAKAIIWQRLPDHMNELDALVNGIIWRVIKKPSRFKGKSKFSTWFYQIVINECNRFLRKYKERCESAIDEDMPASQQRLDAKIDLISLLDTLQGEDHTLMRLKMEGQDFNTIGEALGINRNAALQRWNRLKERLRDAL